MSAREYGKVFTSFWTSPTTQGLSDRARVLAIYLLCGPHVNMIGCFRLPDGYVCDDLGWDRETVSEGFHELYRKGFATRDEASKWVFVRNFMRWNRIDNPNQAKAAAKLFHQVPDSFVAKSELATTLSEQFARFPGCELKPFRNGSETVPEPFRNQEQEQEQEPIQEQKQEISDSSEVPKPAPSEPKDSTTPTTRIANVAALPTDDPVLIVFPVSGDKSKPEWKLTLSKVAQYRESFPGLDVLAEFRRAKQWIIDTGKKKTAKGMPKFLGGWLGRANDRGGNRVTAYKPPQTKGQVKDLYAADVLFNGMGGSHGVESENF